MKSKKLISLLLALVLVLPAITSCAKKTDVTPADAQPDATEQTPVETEDTSTTAYVRKTYENYNYDGYNFRILSIDPGAHYYWMLDDDTGVCNEVWYEEDNAEVQQHSVFTRNTLTEELLNIKISAVWGGGTYEIPELVKTLVKSGGDDFDMTLGSQCKSLPLASEGYFRNLYDIETLDLSNEWWDQEFIDTFTYKNGYIYTITGDYTIFDDYAAAVIFYNKQIVEDYNLDDPADHVDAGTWTLDTMMDMAKKVTTDLDGNGVMNEEDRYGFYDNYYAIIHLTEGCDVKMTELDEEGVPQVVIENEQFINTVQAVFEKVITTGYIYLDEGTHDKTFIKEDRALFSYEQLGGINQLRDMESDFSLLPLPKKDEEQKAYTSVTNGIWCTVLSVGLNNQDVERTGIIMDVLGGMSTDTVDAALHEIVLGPKLFREKRTNDMLTYVLDSRVYDWAKDISWGYPIYGALSEQSNAQTFTLASSIQRNIKVIKAQLRKFLVLFD